MKMLHNVRDGRGFGALRTSGGAKSAKSSIHALHSRRGGPSRIEESGHGTAMSLGLDTAGPSCWLTLTALPLGPAPHPTVRTDA